MDPKLQIDEVLSRDRLGQDPNGSDGTCTLGSGSSTDEKLGSASSLILEDKPSCREAADVRAVTKRTRTPYSKRVCTFCKSRKKKCNGEHPCSNCAARGKEDSCCYVVRKKPLAGSAESKLPWEANAVITLVSIRNDLLSVYSTTVLPSMSIVSDDVALVLSQSTMDIVENKNIGENCPTLFGLRVMVAIAASYKGCDQLSMDAVHLCESVADQVLCTLRNRPDMGHMGHTLIVVAMGFFHLHYYFYGIDREKALKFGHMAIALMDDSISQSSLLTFLKRTIKWSMLVCDNSLSAIQKKVLFLQEFWGANDATASYELLSSSGSLDVESIVRLRIGKLCLPRLYDLVQSLGSETTLHVDMEMENFRLANRITNNPVDLLSLSTKGAPCLGLSPQKVLNDDAMQTINQISELSESSCQSMEVSYTIFALLSIRARALEAIGHHSVGLETAQLAVTFASRCKFSVMHPGYVACLALIIEVLIRNNDDLTMGYLANIIGRHLLVSEGGSGNLYPNTNLRALWWISSTRCSREAFLAGREVMQQHSILGQLK